MSNIIYKLNINDNLIDGDYMDFLQSVDNNRFLIKLDFLKYSHEELYIIIYSYLKNKNIIIRNILLVNKVEGVRNVYRNVNFITNFSFNRFSIWLIESINEGYTTVEDTKIYFASENVLSFLEVQTVSDMRHFCKVPKIYKDTINN